jgi:hypothetical protein
MDHKFKALHDVFVSDKAQRYAPINGIGLTLFEYITVQVGNTLICGENRTDIYKNYLQLMLGNSKESKETWLGTEVIWAKDTAGAFNDLSLESKNKGFIKRFAIFNGGSKVHTMAVIPYPLGQTRKLLIPGINMKFVMKKADDKFLITTNEPAKMMQLKIEKIWIKARARSLEPPLFNALVSKLQQTEASKSMEQVF